MHRPRLLNPFVTLDADFWRDGFYAKPDYRYAAMYEFVHLSPSFQAVLARRLGVPTPYPQPMDAAAVEPTVDNFYVPRGQLTPRTSRALRDDPDDAALALVDDWWDAQGKRLFGVPAPDRPVRVYGSLTRSNPRRTVELTRGQSDSLVVQISLGQSRDDAIRALKKALDQFTFGGGKQSVHTPQYVFATSRIRPSSLGIAAEVLRMYQYTQDMYPVWWIGNHCHVTRTLSFTQEQALRFTDAELAYRKRRLHIATSRILQTALLIAENAARGRFPCVAPFKEAQLDALRRRPGRPSKQWPTITRTG